MHDPQNFLRIALEALDAVQPVLKQYFGRPEKVELKKDGTVVTNLDPEVETTIRAILQQNFPDHGILGEELESVNPEAALQWIIDPIDGTRHFIHGVPIYGSIVALYENGEPLLAIIDVPETGSRYHAIKGQGAFWNGQPVHIQDSDDVYEGILGVSTRFGFLRSGTEEAYDRLLQSHPRVLMTPNCYGHGLAVRGAITAMVNFNISLWDLAATKLLVEEAGGKFCVRKRGDKYDMICGKPAVVHWLLQHFALEPTGLKL